MLLAVAKADDHEVCSSSNTAAWDPSLNTRQARTWDVQNAQQPQAESLANDGINSIAASYLAKNNFNDERFGDCGDYSNQFLQNDKLQNDILCIDNARHNRRDDQLIDSDASRVNANFESCHVGETIIPALKEETQVQQAACYSSDSAAQYRIKGTANNNYKLSGSMSTNECQVQKGGEKSSTSLCLRGNKSKKYSQCGNKALFGCADGSEGACGDNFGLRAELLDDEALEVTSDPAKRVEQEVNQVVRNAISKTISQCIQFALDEALDHTIDIGSAYSE
jgi:hypothetical protein